MLTRLLSVAVLAVMAVTVLAQDFGFGEGAPIIEPNFGSDIKTLNPIIVNDGPSGDAIARIFPSFLQYSVDTIAYEGGVPRGLVESWTISEDGKVYTFALRQDLFWSDGVQMTSADVMWFWDAVKSGETSTPRTNMVDNIESIEAPDAHTIVITFKNANCNSLDLLAPLTPVPAHVYSEVFGTDYAGMDASDYNLNPTVSGSDFVFDSFRPGEQVAMRAYDQYPDAVNGTVIPQGWILKTVTDQVIQMEQYFAGEITYVDSVPEAAQEEVRAGAEAGLYQMYEAPSGSVRFLSLNLADPANPQNGLDEEGNAIDQGHHPIFGDVRVRQALAYGVNYDEVNQGAFFGTGFQVGSHVLPTSWAYPESVTPYPYDTAAAMALLEEAGWVDADGDGIRECSGCLYAEEGAPLAFTIQSNAGNTSQEALYTILQDQWGDLGFDITVEFIDFNILIDNFQAQTYDAVGIFWGYGTPHDPDGTTDVFTPGGDVLGSGFNTQSYNNPRVNELLDQARTLPGCDLETRKALYGEVFQILRDELPWLWLSGAFIMSTAQANVEGWDPRPGGYHGQRWNLDTWTVQP
jgi:peptide/nickel transport system substrate-binding protein